MEHIDIKIVGEEFEIKEFLQLLAKIQYLGTVGASRTIPVHIDGDGSGQLKFEVIGQPEVMKKYQQLIAEEKLIGLDSETFKKQLDDTALEMHYIGE